MKRFLTVAAFAAAAGAAFGQGFTEDFEGGIPGSWTVVDNAGGGVVWMTNSDWGQGNYTNGSGLAAHVDSDNAGAVEFDTELVTPAFTVPGGAHLQLTANYQNFAALDFFDIDINSGSGWVNLLRWNEDHGGFESTPGQDIDLDLSAYGGQSAQVRFHYYDPNSGDWDWYAQIDNVTVTPAPGALALLGLGGLAAARRRR
ncbi:MAG TPA: choice-of-anchor J domain-containing protein [Phycisphaerales bacterium]|nr:choice-of-anchor J domain-containing protein [Phycisphaerales bacterium]